MKARVLKSFIDKHTAQSHKPGDVITVTEERFAEILETAPLVEEIPDESAAEIKEQPKKRTKKTK